MTTATLVTRVAHAGHGAHRFFGHDLFGDLLGKESFTGLLAMAVVGRRLPADEKDLLDCLCGVLCVADPRIWPLKINRLVGAYGGTLAAFCSTQICIESEVIGSWCCGYAARVLVDLRAALPVSSEEPSDSDLVSFLATRKRLVGYGVPFRDKDERLDALRTCVAERGRTHLPFWRLQERLSEVVERTRNIGPNVAIGAAAMLLDLGFDVRQVSVMGHMLILPTIVANAVEGAAQAPVVLRCLPDDAIDYIGLPPRLSERAQRRGGALSVP